MNANTYTCAYVVLFISGKLRTHICAYWVTQKALSGLSKSRSLTFSRSYAMDYVKYY